MGSSERLNVFVQGTAALAAFTAFGLIMDFIGAPAIDSLPEGHWLRAMTSCGNISTRASFLEVSLPLIGYWLPAWIYMCVDLYLDSKGGDAWAKSKLPQPSFSPKLKYNLYTGAIRQSTWSCILGVVNHFVYIVPLNKYINGESVVCGYNPATDFTFFADLWQAASTGDYVAVLIMLGRTVATFYMLLFLTDLVFYSTHRLCHEVPWMYVNVHKFHHQWVDTYGVAAIAAHPFEQWFVNLHTTNLPCILLGIPWPIHTAWATLGSINTTTTHSGFKFPFFSGNVAHDSHHHFPLSEYGINFLCDWFFKTRFADRYDDTGRRRTRKTVN